MSQRSGQSVLYNPAAGQHQVGNNNHSNTLGSSGSRASNSSSSNQHAQNQHSSSTTTVISNGNGSTANSANGSGTGGSGNLNHHYEDLQMNHATGNLVPVGSLSASEAAAANFHSQHIFAQPSMFRQHHQLQNQHDQEEMLVAMINGGGESGGDGHHHSPQSEGGSSHSGSQQYPQVDNSSSGVPNKATKGKKSGGFFPTPGNVMRNSFRKAMGKS